MHDARESRPEWELIEPENSLLYNSAAVKRTILPVSLLVCVSRLASDAGSAVQTTHPS